MSGEMTRDEYIQECQGLIDSFDEHVTGRDVVLTLRALADQVERDGLQESEKTTRIEAFVKALTPAANNETHAWNLWNLLASDQGPMREALEWAWHQHDDPPERNEHRCAACDPTLGMPTVLELVDCQHPERTKERTRQ